MHAMHCTCACVPVMIPLDTAAHKTAQTLSCLLAHFVASGSTSVLCCSMDVCKLWAAPESPTFVLKRTLAGAGSWIATMAPHSRTLIAQHSHSKVSNALIQSASRRFFCSATFAKLATPSNAIVTDFRGRNLLMKFRSSFLNRFATS